MKKGILIKEGKNWRITNPNMPIIGDFGLSDDLNNREVEFDNSGGPVKLIQVDGKKYVRKQVQPINTPRGNQNYGYRGNVGNQAQHKANYFNAPQQNDNIKVAKSPYNFIPLNKTIVVGQMPIPESDKYYDIDDKLNGIDKNRYSGSIDLKIITKTPLFIRGDKHDFFLVNGKPLIPGSSSRGMIRSLIEIISFSRFLKTDQNPMFYRAVADMSNLGKLYSQLTTSKRPVQQGNPQISLKIKSGWLEFKNDQFNLFPSKFSNQKQFYRVNGKYIGKFFEPGFNLEDQNGNTKWKPNGPRISIHTFEKVYFDPHSIKVTIKPKGNNDILYDEIKGTLLTNKGSDPALQEAFLVSTGFIERKHFEWVINPPESNGEKVTGLMEEYKKDKSRDSEGDLLKRIERNSDKLIPCFYTEEGGKIKSIGHTGLHRMEYTKTPAMAILQDEKVGFDFAEALFGFLQEDKNDPRKGFSSRLSFEDAILAKSEQNFLEDISVLQILGEPNPTTFQHYLEQPLGRYTPKNDLTHWNTDQAKIRGYKRYWHRDTSRSSTESDFPWMTDIFAVKKRDFEVFLSKINGLDSHSILTKYSDYFTLDRDGVKMLIPGDLSKIPSVAAEFRSYIIDFFNLENPKVEIDGKDYKITKPQNAMVTCVKRQTAFDGRIRFENLTSVELGCLLSAIDLPKNSKDPDDPKNCFHKLGMGKSLGLGSASIVPVLIVSDRSKRYQKLFEDNKWYDPVVNHELTIEHFKEAFENYVLARIPVEEKDAALHLWDLPRLTQLKTMLTFTQAGFTNEEWLEKTRYMEISKPLFNEDGKPQIRHGKQLTENEYKFRPVLPKPTEVIEP